MSCKAEKKAMCSNASDGCDRCQGFKYAADCCGTCTHYIEDSVKLPGWYDENPGTCTALSVESGLVTDYMPSPWYAPPCLMFEACDG